MYKKYLVGQPEKKTMKTKRKRRKRKRRRKKRKRRRKRRKMLGTSPCRQQERRGQRRSVCCLMGGKGVVQDDGQSEK
jgi:hypothetical protein